jgi:AP endonuclease-2
LITKGLVPWVKAADVQQDAKGSDHCPVFVDLHEQITTSDGSVLRLRDLLGARNTDSAPPRLATRFWDEYSGKQTQLHKFFAKKATECSKAGSSDPTPDDDTSDVATQSCSSTPLSLVDQHSQTALDSRINTTVLSPVISQPSPTSTGTSPIPATTNNATSGPVPDQLQKRKLPWDTPLEKVKKPKGKKVQKGDSTGSTSQTKLSSFFAKPKAAAEPELQSLTVGESSPTASKTVKKGKEKEASLMDIIDVDECPVDFSPVKDNIPGMEVEELLYLSTQSSSSQGSIQSTPSGNGPKHKSNNGNYKDVWSAILAPTPIPRCTVHNEPAKEYTVNKPGPNKGKQFFVCSR